MSTGLVVYQGRRQAQTGLQRLVECVVLPAVGGFNIREITGLHQVHKCLPAGRLPGLDVDILAVVAGAQRINLDLWLHNALLAGRAMLAGSRPLVNGSQRKLQFMRAAV